MSRLILPPECHDQLLCSLYETQLCSGFAFPIATPLFSMMWETQPGFHDHGLRSGQFLPCMLSMDWELLYIKSKS